MSVTIYFEARRKDPLSKKEEAKVQSIVSKCNNKTDVAKLVDEGGGELFGFYPRDNDPKVILKGAVKLPLKLGKENLDDFIYVAETWITCLSEIRNNVKDADWEVYLDDKPLPWKERENKFDLPLNSKK